MFYTKNVPHFERALRILAGVGIAVAGVLTHQSTAMELALAGTGIFVGMTGFFGFCPMCAMVGRKPAKP